MQPNDLLLESDLLFISILNESTSNSMTNKQM